ncbi:MAG: C1 family peptidase [Bdellovibrionota bacterium]
MRTSIVSGIVLFLSIVSLNASASDKELEQVKHAIKTRSAKWVANKNHVSELTDKEKADHLGAAPLWEGAATPTGTDSSMTSASTAPATFDWRNMNGVNYVTPIKNQGSCGSCWVFAPTAALESQVAIAQGGVQKNASEQVGLSCSGGGSCSGGYASTMSSYMISTGLPDESYFPYTGANTACSSAATGWQNYTYKPSSKVSVATNNIAALETAISTYGPVVVRLAIFNDFYYYASGVYKYTTGAFVGFHYMTAVGYDSANRYFIVKNSWGTGWGQAGYVLMSYDNLTNGVGFGATENIAYYTSNAPASLTLSTPNTGSSYPVGTNLPIKWIYTGTPCSTVSLQLLDRGMVSTTITSGVAIGSNGAGTYNWTIPVSVVPESTYQVQVTCVANPSFTSTGGTFTMAARPAAPAAPTGLTANLATSGPRKRPVTQVQLRWNTSTGATSYSVYRNGTLLRSGVTTTSWQDGGTVAGGGTYNYNVKAVDSLNQASGLSNTATVSR